MDGGWLKCLSYLGYLPMVRQKMKLWLRLKSLHFGL